MLTSGLNPKRKKKEYLQIDRKKKHSYEIDAAHNSLRGHSLAAIDFSSRIK